ncbi:MAG TPA: YfiR family protein [Candidatus Kapabacteria bacterium]|nr:YfiR family protein [Candidatus Kapabacteria bacterium]
MKKLIAAGSIFIFAILLYFIPLLSEPADRTMKENELKSALLYKICKFTRWSRPVNAGKSFIITILGPTTPGNEITIPPEKMVQDKRIVIKKIKKLIDIRDSHVLFITAPEAYRLNEILSYTEGKDILTVSDTRGFSEKGVIINFYVEDAQVKFEINREAEEKSAIKLYSQVFRNGKIVEDEKK